MLVELKQYHDSLQDKKSEIRRRSLWLLLPIAALGLAGYILNSSYSPYLYAPALFGALAFVSNVVTPLRKREVVFEKVYKAIELTGHQDNRATRTKLHRLLKSVLSLPLGASSALLSEDVNVHKKMDELIKRRLLPAARLGSVKETTVETLAHLLRSPSVSALKDFNDQLTMAYEDVEEVTPWSRLSGFRRSSVGRFVVPMTGAIVLGFPIAIGVSYLWIVGLIHSDFVKYASDPTFGAVIFSFGAALTLLLYRQFRRSG